MKKSCSILFIQLFFFGCSSVPKVNPEPIEKPKYPLAKENYPYKLRINDYYGVEGFGLIFYLSEIEITIVYSDDFGNPRKEIFQKILSSEERSRLNQFLSIFPLDKLKESYVNPNVDDGLQIDFDFKLAGRPPKKIELRNHPQDDLFALCEEINRLIPEKFYLKQARGATILGS